ncbi:IS1380 family transposase [Pseudactinotalea sp. HY158]|uniref:IS1380 family transposase n=1 Tax=Pseudactinotalea sp. HY158 TaxID=2654547 RepID=UPI00129CD9BB|nr:IS1380 family transposase [Pseudactinotalea sp. HY158]QGH68698.1 IS1380 family transposase [Pseudactinotalea sp. HY158]
MNNVTRFYPRTHVDTAASGAVGQAGGVLLTETVAVTGLGAELSAALSPWRKRLAVHDPAKVLTDLALTLAVGGDHLCDIALLRAEPGIYGSVASDATVSRTIDSLAADAPAALKAINTARAAARKRAWALAGKAAPDAGTSAKAPLIIDLDATLVASHSEKESAAPTYKRGYGFHPLCAFADHGADGTGEPLAIGLRPGNAGSNTAADHIEVIKAALAQLPGHKPGTRPGRRVLIRTDGAGASHALLDFLTRQRLSYSVGFALPHHTPELLEKIPEHVWTPAYDAHDQVRDGAWVAELTDLLDLSGWPKGMRVIARKERPHPGAQLRITDIDGHRITAFATNTKPGGPGTQLPDLELRHRRRARCEDRIRIAKDTGLRALPLHDFTQNQIWCAIVMLAAEMTAWMQMLALHGHTASRWEPKNLRLRLFTIPATLARTGRRALLHLAEHAPWTHLAALAITRLRRLAAPG